MAALRGGAVLPAAGVGAGVCGASTGAASRGPAGGGAASRQPPLRAGSPLQCFSFEEDDLNLSLDTETIPEAEEILGTMQNYLDSSVISIIEDLSLSEGKACLDAQNELSLLTAITEILDSTDDETLSPFDTIVDTELLTSLRERENPSFQKFLSLSRPVLECKSPALEQPKGLWSLSSGGSIAEAGKTDVDLAWDCIAHSLEDPSPPKKQACSTPRVERKQGWSRAHEQLPLQRSDGEEEDEEAASNPELDSSMEAAEFSMNVPEVVAEEHEDPCVINTGDVSLSELVKSMHPYCLPTFTVCVDPESEPMAKELLSGPVVLEIVPREGENVEIPVVLQSLAPSFPDLEPQLLGTEGNAESVPVHGEDLPGDPAPETGMEEEQKPPGQEPSRATLDSKTPVETAVSSKREICEKGRGRERARKSRKKKVEEGPSEEGRPGRDCMAHQLRSGRSRRAARPSLQVSDFLARQLEQARKEGQMELHAERASQPRGRPRGMAGASLPTKEPPELPKELEPEMTDTLLEKGETAVPVEKTTEEPLATKQPSPVEQEDKEAAQPDVGMPKQDVGMEPPERVHAAEPSETLPKEAKPKALSLREYRMRMQHRQSSMGSGKEGKKQAASKWPSVPEPPTELADIPCLVTPARPPTETPRAQKSLEKSASSPAGPPPSSKAPAAPAPAPAPAPALAPASAPPPPVTPVPFVAPTMPPAAGAAPPGMPPPATTGAYAVYPSVPPWPCFGPQPLGCHALPPPPGAGPPGTFHMVAGLPPPPMAWPPPALPPPPPFIPGGPYGPVGWPPPSYWPGIPIPPPPVPPMAYGDPALQGAAASSVPAGGHPSTALLHGQSPPAPELPAFPVQPPLGSEMGTAGSQARPGISKVSNPRRQARSVGESSFPKGPSAPAPTQPLVTPSGAAAQPSMVPPAAPAPNVAAPAQPLEEPPPAAPIQLSKAPPAVVPLDVSAAAVPAGGSPGTYLTEDPVGPAKIPVDKTPLEPPNHKPITQALAPPPKPCRESNKPPAARPWRHQPLISPAQPSDSNQDIVQAFISEIGIEAADLSSLLEQFEKSEAKKEEAPVQPPEERQPARSAGSEPQPERKPPDSLQASELANVAGLTPPATPPHQLWKPLPTVSLLAKTKSPVLAPQEGSQRTTKLTKPKPLPQSKLQGRSPAPGSAAPSHVCSGDHDYCIPRTARLENSSIAGTQHPATETGSRWNVKHHRDITIKPISSLTKRTLDQPKPAPATSVGPSQESPGAACPTPLDYRTSVPSKAVTGADSPATSVLLSPAASPCRDQEVWTPSTQPGRVAAKKSLRCYRRPQDSPSPSAGSWRAGRSRASRSFSSSSDGASESSSSSSSSRSRSRSLSPPPKRWRGYRSRCSHSSSSRSSCGSCGRSRDRSSSSSSSSSYSSRSPSRRQSRSRSPSPCRRSNRRRRYSYDAQDHYQRQRILQKERAIEERRVVFIGKIPSRMTRSELRHRFSVFGDIEECTLHFRSEGDNYGFVTYRYAEEAFAAIESGHKLRRPDEQPFDLCFGGRRQFCRRNYADLDSNREDFDPAPVKSKFDSLDFDTLLRQAQRSLRR